MDSQTPDHDFPLAPPTEPIALRPVRRESTWPTFLGVVSIIFGVVGLFNGLATMASSMLVDMARQAAPNAQANVWQVVQKWQVWTISSGAFSSILAIMLMVAGIGLTVRRRWGVKLHMAWAVLKLIWSPVLVGVGLLAQIDSLKATEADMAAAGNPTFAFTGVMRQTTLVMTGLTLLWLWLLPCASLWWLTRPKVREEVGGWR